MFYLAHAYYNIHVLIAALCFLSAAKWNTLLAKSFFMLTENSERRHQVAPVCHDKIFFNVIMDDQTTRENGVARFSDFYYIKSCVFISA